MGIFSMPQSLGFVGKIFDSKVTTEPIIELPSFKPIASFTKQNDLPRCVPEKAGIPSSVIQGFLDALKTDRTLNMHGVTIARNGKIICEASFGAQRLDVWKYTFSACKSVTALAIGILVDDGILGLRDRVVDIFPKEAGAIGKIKLKDLTVEDLLTMRSSVFFTELDSVVDENWLNSFFDAPTKGEVGKTFRYNSLNTYVLSAIVAAKTGTTLSAFLQERLFSPLGILEGDWFWEPCPKGIEKGGWGLYIRPDDFVKIAQLVMQKGIWEEKRIISEAYITAATSPHVDVTMESTRFNYGYQIWVGKDTDTFLFNGLFGQNVLGFRRNGIIIVSNAGNCELFQQSNFFKYVVDFFDKDFGNVSVSDTKARRALEKSIDVLSSYVKQKRRLRIRSRRKTNRAIEYVVGKRYVHTAGHANSLGILPLILQAVQNRYASGFVGLSFAKRDHTLCMDYEENGSTTSICLGIEVPYVQTVVLGKIPFVIAASVKFTKNEDARNVIVIRIDFLEYPSSRIIKLIFLDEDTVLMKNEEAPGDELAKDAINLVLDEIPDKSLVSGIIDKIGIDYFIFRAEQALSPRILLKKDTEKKKE